MTDDSDKCGIPINFLLMKRRMLFKIGVTVIIFVAVVLFFIVEVEDGDSGLYQALSADDGGVYLIEMAVIDPEELDSGKGVVNENRVASVDKEFISQDINAQIDKEQNELLARREKSGERNSDDELDKENLNSMEREYYYDNSVPDPDRQDKRKERVELFEPRDQKPVVSRDFASHDSNKILVHLCVVVCENRAIEGLTMLKSAAIVTNDARLVFHIVADKERQPVIKAELDSWPSYLHHHISYHIYDVAFPHSHVTLTAWNKLYKPCASQRLFLPDRLTNLDSVIYVDTDTIFLQSVGALWSFFKHFNSSQLVGLVRESEDGTAGWYNRFANHPYYGQYGVNSGVMLMNMTRIRRGTDWLSVLQEDYETYRLAMTWGDQDLINIYLSRQPDQVYVISCDWNYRTDHCMYTSNCRAAEEKGISLVHASRGAFYSSTEPVFGAIHQAFQHVVLGPDQVTSLTSDLKKRLKDLSSEISSCNSVTSLFLTHLDRLSALQQSDQVHLPSNWHEKNGDLSYHNEDKKDSKIKRQFDSVAVNTQQNKIGGLDKDKNVYPQGNNRYSSRGVGRKRQKSESIVGEKMSRIRSNVKSERVMSINGDKRLDNLQKGVKKLNSYELLHDEVYINNKLKAGRVPSFIVEEKDILKSNSEKMKSMQHQVDSDVTWMKIKHEGKGDSGGDTFVHRDDVNRKVVTSPHVKVETEKRVLG